MKSQIKIFETGILDGVMSRNKKFYDENLTQEEIVLANVMALMD